MATKERSTNIDVLKRLGFKRSLYRNLGEDEHDYSWDLAQIKTSLEKEYSRISDVKNYQYEELKRADLDEVLKCLEFIDEFFSFRNDGYADRTRNSSVEGSLQVFINSKPLQRADSLAEAMIDCYEKFHAKNSRKPSAMQLLSALENDSTLLDVQYDAKYKVLIISDYEKVSLKNYKSRFERYFL